MRLIILGAGYGGRLSPVSENIPKPLFELSPGVTILDRQLESAKRCGIKNIYIVVGFQASKIEAKVMQRADLELNIQTLYNPFYRTHNNLVSLWVAISVMDDDFIMINGDNVFRSSLLTFLNNSTGEFNILVAKKSMYDEDDTKLILKNDKIIRLGKDIPLDKANAEWIGMCVVRGSIRKLFINKIKELIRKPELLEGAPHYLSVFQGLADDGVSLETIRVESEAWADIDYQMDLDFVSTHLTRFND